MNLRRSLAKEMRKNKIYSHKELSLSDLYISTGDYGTAEEVLIEQLAEEPENNELTLRLADIQFLNNNRSRAENNYFKILLYAPELIGAKEIAYKALRNLYLKQGKHSILAAAALHKLVPFKGNLPDISFQNKDLKQAHLLYCALCEAEKARSQSDNMKLIIEARKKIKSINPPFFDHYMSFIKMGLKR